MYDGNKQIFVFFLQLIYQVCFFCTALKFFFTFGLLVVMDSQLRSHI